jgi:hypothetical protein
MAVADPLIAVADPLIAVADPLMAVADPLMAVADPLMAVADPLIAVADPLMAVADPLMAVAGPLMAVAGPLMAVAGTRIAVAGPLLAGADTRIAVAAPLIAVADTRIAVADAQMPTQDTLMAVQSPFTDVKSVLRAHRRGPSARLIHRSHLLEPRSGATSRPTWTRHRQDTKSPRKGFPWRPGALAAQMTRRESTLPRHTQAYSPPRHGNDPLNAKDAKRRGGGTPSRLCVPRPQRFACSAFNGRSVVAESRSST